jgi:hypothetical protein
MAQRRLRPPGRRRQCAPAAVDHHAVPAEGTGRAAHRRRAGRHHHFAGADLAAYVEINAASDAVVVEGVGGFRVPLNDEFDTADLAEQLALPVCWWSACAWAASATRC